MNATHSSEIVVAFLLLVVLFFLWDPFLLRIPSAIVMMIEVGLLLSFVIFSVFVWRESASDEREETHRMFADRLAFLAGAAVLAVGVLVGAFIHRLDPWLVAALAAMVLAKIVGLIYGKLRH